MKHILIIVGSLLLQGSLLAQGHFTMTPELDKAYTLSFDLRLVEANQLLDQAEIDDPDNVLIPYIRNYSAFLRAIVTDDKASFDAFEAQKKATLEAIKTNGDKSSPYYRYCQAEVRLQWAITRAKFGEYIGALQDVRKSYKLLKKNAELHPEFVANKKSLGVIHALVGTVPPNYAWAAKAIGLSGTIEQGLGEIEDVLQYAKTHDFAFEEETVVLYSFLQLHLRAQPDRAWKTIRSVGFDPKQSPMACFAIAGVAQYSGHTDEAIRILQQRPQGEQYLEFPYLDLMLGIAMLRKGDPKAEHSIKVFLKTTRGQHYIKQAYQLLAWNHLLNGDQVGYTTNMKLARHKGQADIEPDKAALREAKRSDMPNLTLLKARLRFDGGYSAAAYKLLADTDEHLSWSPRDQLERIYRLGRIKQQQGNSRAALRYYDQTIAQGSDSAAYFACSAALQSGIINEQEGNLQAATTAFKICLDLSPDQYKSGLHQKAKAGLNRLKKK